MGMVLNYTRLISSESMFKALIMASHASREDGSRESKVNKTNEKRKRVMKAATHLPLRFLGLLRRIQHTIITREESKIQKRIQLLQVKSQYRAIVIMHYFLVF